MVKIVIVGAAGRMGRQLIADALADPELQVIGAVVKPGSPQLGEDVGGLCGLTPTGVTIGDSLEEIVDRADVVIEFTNAAATIGHIETTHARGKAHVIGTTGLEPEQRRLIEAAAHDIPVVLAPNMGVGINVVASILPSLVKALGEGYDIELIEFHHRTKRDAPSGTSLMLAEVIEGARGEATASKRVYGRQGLTARAPGEIGIHGVRAGGIPGDHRVLLAGDGDEIELIHRAHNRKPSSLGALRAAKFVVGQPPRLYTMRDVLA